MPDDSKELFFFWCVWKSQSVHFFLSYTSVIIFLQSLFILLTFILSEIS